MVILGEKLGEAMVASLQQANLQWTDGDVLTLIAMVGLTRPHTG